MIPVFGNIRHVPLILKSSIGLDFQIIYYIWKVTIQSLCTPGFFTRWNIEKSRIENTTRADKNYILGDPGTVSRVWRKGATKVFKHGRSCTGGNASNWKLTFVAPHDPTDCPWVSEDVRIIALKRKLLFRKCAVDFLPANFFWVQCVRFLPCCDRDFWKRPSDFRRFQTILRRLPNVTENVRRCSDGLWAI